MQRSPYSRFFGLSRSVTINILSSEDNCCLDSEAGLLFYVHCFFCFSFSLKLTSDAVFAFPVALDRVVAFIGA